METKDSAVHLLRLWKEAKNTYEVALLYFQGSEIPFVEEMREISRRLDEKAEAAGIYYVAHGEYFRYERFSFDYIGSGRNVSKLATIDTVTAREQQAIQEWLLIKNEEKTA